MIIDKIENAKLYYSLGSDIEKGLEYIQNTDFSELSPGKYEIAGDKMFAAVSEYETKNESDGKLEAHINYLDIQFVAVGTEKIGYTPLEGQAPTVPYNPEKDVVFYKEPVSFTTIEKGMFAIFLPTDLHMPGITAKSVSLVKKVVVKIRL